MQTVAMHMGVPSDLRDVIRQRHCPGDAPKSLHRYVPSFTSAASSDSVGRSMKISRRDFHTTLLSASAVAQAARQDTPAPAQRITLPAGAAVAAGGEPFDFPLPPSPRLRWKVTGLARQYFMEWLPGLFERTLVIEEWKTPQSQLQWIFTGPMGGFTVEAGAGKVRVFQRYDDSPALAQLSPVRNARHPERVVEETSVEYDGPLQSIAVTLDHRLSLRVSLNGKEAVVEHCLLDVNQIGRA